MYLIELGPVVYGPRGGGRFTLPHAVDELRGVRDARVLRADDFTVAVVDAGDIAHLTHLRRDGRRTAITRRKVGR